VKRRALVVSVDNHRCHRYGVCEAEAPRDFALGEDGRLHYERHPAEDEHDSVRMAARCCPMQAVSLERRRERRQDS
jgi:sulfoxide reductase heme-binding subunit YedZ